jgi:hypothetical protein
MLERPRLLAARSVFALLPPNALALPPLLPFCICGLEEGRDVGAVAILVEGREALPYPRSPVRFPD